MRLDLITHHSKIITIVNKKFLSNWHNIHVELKKRRIIKMKLNIKKLITVSGTILMLTPISNGFVNSNNVQVQATTRHKKVSRSRSNKRINLPKVPANSPWLMWEHDSAMVFTKKVPYVAVHYDDHVHERNTVKTYGYFKPGTVIEADPFGPNPKEYKPSQFWYDTNDQYVIRRKYDALLWTRTRTYFNLLPGTFRLFNDYEGHDADSDAYKYSAAYFGKHRSAAKQKCITDTGEVNSKNSSHAKKNPFNYYFDGIGSEDDTGIEVTYPNN